MNWTRKARKAWVGWSLLGLFVALWDKYCDTLSSGFHSALRRQPKLVLTGWLVTSAHLFKLLPKWIDPFYLVGRWIR